MWGIRVIVPSELLSHINGITSSRDSKNKERSCKSKTSSLCGTSFLNGGKEFHNLLTNCNYIIEVFFGKPVCVIVHVVAVVIS